MWPQIVLCLFQIILLSADVSTARNNSSISVPPVVSDIFSKLHQNDYQLTFEWAELVRYNKSYYKHFDIHTFKYNRTTTVVNITTYLNIDLGYGLELVFQTYKFASNEYRLFPMRFELNFCESKYQNALGFSDFDKCGNVSCPLLKNVAYHSCNWKPDQGQFPPLIPTGKYMLEIQGVLHNHEVFLQRFYGSISRPFV